MEHNVFYGSPIIVRDKNQTIFKIIELSLKPFKEFKFLLIENINEDLNKCGEFKRVYSFAGPKTTHCISIENSLKNIKITYFDSEKNIVKEEVHNIEIADKFRKTIDPESVRYNEIKKYVITNMDMFEGTDEEKATHTEQIHSCSYNLNAKNYVMTRIQTLVSQFKDIKSYDVQKISKNIFSDEYGLGILQELDEDPEVGEIMVNARTFPQWECYIYYIKNQRKYRFEKTFDNVDQLINILNRIIAFDKKSLNSVNNAIVEAIRPNGDRVNIVIPNASDNYALNIRKFTNFIPDPQGMKKVGTVTPDIEKLFNVLVRGKANIGIGGMMGTGKTTLINYLLTHTPKEERKTIIASVAETDIDRVLKGHDVLVFKVDESKNITFSKLLRTSLRTTSDRVIIPESRGSEFKELYEANVKTKGNMFTAHATEAESFMDICVDMYMSSPDAAQESAKYIKDKISKAIDMVIIMIKAGDKIRIKSISEVYTEDGEYKKMIPLVIWKNDRENISDGHYEFTGNTMSDSLCSRLNEMGVPYSQIDEVNNMLKTKSRG